MAFDSANDICLSLWAQCYPKLIDFPPNAKVLEIGCAEADWQTPMLKERPDLHLFGIDWRRTARPGAILKADVMTATIDPASFDAVVSISAIEHIGLGAYDGDPIAEDGDALTMLNVRNWVKPLGLVYLDVPYGERYEVVGNKFRRYDDAAIASRLVPYGLRERAHFLMQSGHPDAPYIALVLQRV